MTMIPLSVQYSLTEKELTGICIEELCLVRYHKGKSLTNVVCSASSKVESVDRSCGFMDNFLNHVRMALRLYIAYSGFDYKANC